MIALIVTATWVFGPWILFPIAIAGGALYNRRHRPPPWSDDDFIWAEEHGITVPEERSTP